MTATVPGLRRLKPVSGGPDGAVMNHYAKYARDSVMTVFENIGGMAAFTDTAAADRKWFYEKFWTRQLPKEHDVQHHGPVIEDLLKQLDSRTIDITPVEAVDEDGD